MYFLFQIPNTLILPTLPRFELFAASPTKHSGVSCSTSFPKRGCLLIATPTATLRRGEQLLAFKETVTEP